MPRIQFFISVHESGGFANSFPQRDETEGKGTHTLKEIRIVMVILCLMLKSNR
jgi:hypothetical protein